MNAPTLTFRDLAILRAVAAGSAELADGAGADLFLDGRCCCDQLAAHRLASAGLIAPAGPAVAAGRLRARLTDSGTRQLRTG